MAQQITLWVRDDLAFPSETEEFDFLTGIAQEVIDNNTGIDIVYLIEEVQESETAEQEPEEYCPECGGIYPPHEKSESGPWHSLSCSLHEFA